MATTDFFTSCLPAIRTNVATCGSVTICDVAIPAPDELDGIFVKSGDYRLNEALFHYQLEANMCQARQSNLFNFLVASSLNLSKKISLDKLNSGLLAIKPYVMIKRKGEVDNNNWRAHNGFACDVGGGANGAGAYWSLDFISGTNIPANVGWFNAGERIFIRGITANGTSTNTAWLVISSSVIGSDVRVVLQSQNTNSNLAAARLAAPVGGVAVLGTANISDFESWCHQEPGLINTTYEPYWTETVRASSCQEELYDQWREQIMAGNAMYRELYDLDTISYNRQMAESWKRRWMNTIFYSKALANQTLHDMASLADIDAILWDWTEETGEGRTSYWAKTDAHRCVGKKANVVGMYEQMAKCERVRDMQGLPINLPALFREFFKIKRIREATGHPNPRVFELFMPESYMVAWQTALLSYFKGRSLDMMRLNENLAANVEQSPMGFRYRKFQLDYPDIELRLVTDNYFSDEMAEFEAQATALGAGYEGLANVGRKVWLMDWSNTYVGIIGTDRITHRSGDIQTLAAVDPSYMCVMKVPRKTVTLTSTQYTVVVECPAAGLILENMSGDAPIYDADDGADYGDNPAA
jgi:hypothetical protein